MRIASQSRTPMREENNTTTHVAGCFIQIGPRCIQRCLICGHKLIDVDLARMAAGVPDDDKVRATYWETGALVQEQMDWRSGNVQWTLVGILGFEGEFEVERLPDDFCLALVEE